jgi:hypothetical protein
MKKDKPTTDEDKSASESDTQDMSTLFSSDNTELTDFTQRVRRAIRGEGQDELNSKGVTNLNLGPSAKQGNNSSSIKNNVVNLFKQK